MYDNYGMSADDQVNMGQGGENPFGDMGGFNMGDFFNQGGMGGQGQQGGNFEDVFKDFDDFFGMGGMGKKTHRSVKGQDIFQNLDISFQEAVSGTTKEVNFAKRYF